MHEPWADPLYVAYVYPGWHRDAFRPDIDEWHLLDRFQPYFDGHQPPARPLDGPYDDSTGQTARRQLGQAAAAGIGAFSYFMYFSDGDFLMHRPLCVALGEAHGQPVRIATTWCIRLPHRSLPVAASDDESQPPRARGCPPDVSVTDLTIGEAVELLAPDEHACISFFVPQPRRGGSPGRAVEKRWADQLYAERAETGRPVALAALVSLLARLAEGGNWARVLRDRATRDTARCLTVGQLERLVDLVEAAEIPSITVFELEQALELGDGSLAQTKGVTVAYDDDDRIDWGGDAERLVDILQYLSRSGELTVARLMDLVRVVHETTSGKQAVEVALPDVLRSLRAQGLSDMPMETVGKALELVADVPAGANPLEHVRLADVQRLMLAPAQED